MKTIFFLALGSIILNGVFAQTRISYDPPACEPRLANLEKAFGDARPALTSLSQAIDEDTKLLVFGEDHHQFEAKKGLINIYQGLKKNHPKLDCVFLELGNEHQELFNNFLDGKMTQDKFIRTMTHINFNGKPYTEEYVQGYMKVLTPWIELAIEAKELGGKIFLIDATAEEVRQIYYKKLNDTAIRNQAFADRISKIFEEKKCQMSLMPIGYMHTNSPMPGTGGADTRVQTLARKNGIKTIAVNFTSTTYEANSPFFFLDFKYQSYMAYFYDHDFNPESPEDVARMEKFNAKEESCLEKAKAFIPDESVVFSAKEGTLPAYGPAGIMSARQFGQFASMNQVDFWLWIKSSNPFGSF